MKSHWRKLASVLPSALEKGIYRRYHRRKHKEWLLGKEKAPLSHLAKQELIKQHAVQHNLKTLIETGTYLGDMVFAMHDRFNRIVSIELSAHFYKKAKARFRGSKSVEIINGNSGEVLHRILPALTEPALFWLDGHYSGGLTAKGDKECPIYEELASVLVSPHKHIILVDDARLFRGENDYPTIEELERYITHIRTGSVFNVSGDVIIIKLN